MGQDLVARAAAYTDLLGLAIGRGFSCSYHNYLSCRPAVAFILQLMEHLASSMWYANLLVCADCGRPVRKYHADHRHHEGPRAVVDFRDLVCAPCNTVVRTIVDLTFDYTEDPESAFQEMLKGWVDYLEGRIADSQNWLKSPPSNLVDRPPPQASQGASCQRETEDQETARYQNSPAD